jgi:hypothetical protein
MKVVEFKGKDLETVRMLAKAIMEHARYGVRVAVDVDGFKVSIDHGVWTPGYGTPKK